MNCKPENYSIYIELRIRGWEQVAWMGIDESDRLRSQKNFLRLMKQHPELARSLGYTEQSVPTRSKLLNENYRAPWTAR